MERETAGGEGDCYEAGFIIIIIMFIRFFFKVRTRVMVNGVCGGGGGGGVGDGLDTLLNSGRWVNMCCRLLITDDDKRRQTVGQPRRPVRVKQSVRIARVLVAHTPPMLYTGRRGLRRVNFAKVSRRESLHVRRFPSLCPMVFFKLTC